MPVQISSLPRQVPVGTTYVVVGRNGLDGKMHVFSRYLKFPDGRRIELQPDRPAARRVRAVRPQETRRKRPEKILTKPGTSSAGSR